MVNGVPKFQAMLRRKGAAVISAGKTAAEKGGNDFAALAQALAPRDDGDLIASIRVEDAQTIKTSRGDRGFVGVVVRAGDSTTMVSGHFQNARIQEFGTAKMPANPFFFPAWRANRTRIRGSITRAVRKAWLS